MVFSYFIKWKENLRIHLNLLFRLTSLLSKTFEKRLMFVMKINFAGTICRKSNFSWAMPLFCSLDFDAWNGNINLKLVLAYVQRGYLFCTDQQRIYHILLLLLYPLKQLRAFLRSRHPTVPFRQMTTNNTGYFCLVTNCKRCSYNSSRQNLSCCSQLY